MKTTKMTLQKLRDDLKNAGIKSSVYSKNPSPGSGFSISDSGGKEIKLFYKEDWSKINSVHVSKKHKQAVINVTDGKRDIKNKVNVTITLVDGAFSYMLKNKYFYKKDPSQSKDLFLGRIKSQLRNQHLFSVSNFNYSKLKILNEKSLLEKIYESYLKFTKEKKFVFSHSDLPQYRTFVVDFEYKDSGSHNSILCGIDESAYFVCLLPRHCKSVEEAHAALRPKNISKNAIRQGEWFLDPVSDDMNKKISNSVNNIRKEDRFNGSHVAKVSIRFGSFYYVNISFRETRKNRHKTIYMNKWHKIVKNREKDMPLSMSGGRTID